MMPMMALDGDEQLFYKIINGILNINNEDSSILFKEFNQYFHKLNNSMIHNKVIAIYSYNKNSLAKIFYQNPSSIKNFHHIANLKFKDKIKLFYINGSKFPHHKLVKIIFYSEKKMKFLKYFNNSLATSLDKLFINKNKFFIYNSPFNLLYLDPNSNERFATVNQDIVGSNKINLTITTMEAVILKQSINNTFLLMVDSSLSQMEYFLNIYEKAQDGFHSDKFFSLKANILLNFLNKKSNQQLNDINNSQWTNNYIFDENKQDIAREKKLKIINYFLSRELFLKIYEYIY